MADPPAPRIIDGEILASRTDGATPTFQRRTPRRPVRLSERAERGQRIPPRTRWNRDARRRFYDSQPPGLWEIRAPRDLFRQDVELFRMSMLVYRRPTWSGLSPIINLGY